MQVAYPAWNDDIYVWRRILPKSVPKLDDRNISGYLVINFMHNWNGEHLPLISTVTIRLLSFVLHLISTHAF
ncbi:hypothetical protein PVAP13_6KG151700 [Panicum virgatum]|uniref:Uncharacterized protein n=1 Tax=Panicum virgatum TaxID=38727 RepID=A0A8T0RD57_PANVG|nr:hypothetical protein PVAP13_6KG151700 [Panicum virgatum]